MQRSAYFVVISTFVAAECAKLFPGNRGPAADKKTTSAYYRNVSQSQQAHSEPSRECFKITKSMDIFLSLKSALKMRILCGGAVRSDIMDQLNYQKCENESCSNSYYVGVCPCRNATKCKNNDDFEKTACLSTKLFEILGVSNETTMSTTSGAANFNSTTDSIFENYDQLMDPPDYEQVGDIEALPTTTARRATFNTISIASNLHLSPMTSKNGSKPVPVSNIDVFETRPAEDTSTPFQQVFVTKTSTLMPCYSYSMDTTNDLFSTTTYGKSRSTTAGTNSDATKELLQSSGSTHPSRTMTSSENTKLSQSTASFPGSITTASTHGITVPIDYENEKISASKSSTTSIVTQTQDRSTNLSTNTSMSPLPTSKTPKIAKNLDTSATRRNSPTQRERRNKTSARNYTSSKQSTKLDTHTKEPTQGPTLHQPSSSHGIERLTSSFSKDDFGDSSRSLAPTRSSRSVGSDSTTLSQLQDASNSISDSIMPRTTWAISLSTSTETAPAKSSATRSLKSSTSGKIDFTPLKSTKTIRHLTSIPSADINCMSSASSKKSASTESTKTGVTSTLSVSSQEPLISKSPASPASSTTTWYQPEERSGTTDSQSDGTFEFVRTSIKSSSPVVPTASSFPKTITNSNSIFSTTEGATEAASTQSTTTTQVFTTKHFTDTSGSVVNSGYTSSNFPTSHQLTNKESTSDVTDAKTKATEVLDTASTKLQPTNMTTLMLDSETINPFSFVSFESSTDVKESESALVAKTTKSILANTSIANFTSLETTHSTSAANLGIITLSSTVISNAMETSQEVSFTQDETDLTLGTHETSSTRSETSSVSNLHATITVPSTALKMKTVRFTATGAEPSATASSPTVSDPVQSTTQKEEITSAKLSTIYLPTNQPSYTSEDVPAQKSTLPVTETRFISTTRDGIRSSSYEESHEYEQSSSGATHSSKHLEITTLLPLPQTSKQIFLETDTEQSTTTLNERRFRDTKGVTAIDIVRQGSSSKEKDKYETVAWNTATTIKASTIKPLLTGTVLGVGSTSTSSETKRLSSPSISATTKSEYKGDVVHRDADNSFSTTQKVPTKETSVDATPFTSLEHTISAKQTSKYWHDQKVSTNARPVEATPSTPLKNTLSATKTSHNWHELSLKEETTGFSLFGSTSKSKSFEYPLLIITGPLRQSSTSSESKNDVFNKSASSTDDYAISSSFDKPHSTAETYEKILPRDEDTTLKQWTTPTKATTSSLQECQSSCSSKYQEGPHYCYRILSAKESTTYRRALKSCQDEDGELADEVDFRNAEVMEALEQVASETYEASAKIYVNERNSELITQRRQVRLITLKGSTRLFLNVVGFAGMNEVLTNVYGVCRRKKNCEDLYCYLNDYDTLGVSRYLVMPRIHPKMRIGEMLQIPCAKGKSKSVEVTCGEKGALEPHDIGRICGEDHAVTQRLPGTHEVGLNKTNEERMYEHDDSIFMDTWSRTAFNPAPHFKFEENSTSEWEAETSLISAELKSCSDCHVLGTSNCQSANGSYSCVCKPEWSGHTCWKSPDQCRLKDVQCGANGSCISAIDKAYCDCDEGFSGEHCDVMSPQLSFYSKTKSSILSAANAGVLLVGAGEILMMIVKGLMKLHFPKSGEDTQVFCQNMRSLLLSIAGFIVLFFHHPALFNINAFACGVWLYLETTCYSLSIGFFALESQNVHEVVYGNARRSQFWDLENKTPYEAPPVATNSVTMGLIMGIGIAVTMAVQMSKLVTNWSCMGHFSQQTLTVWLPVVIFNTCAALTATFFAYKSYFILTKIPQYRHKTSVYLKAKGLDAKSCIEKCYRNVAFVAFGPWLLLATWMTLALSFDWVTVGSINLIAMIVSFFYTACNFLQSAFTNPNLYSKFVRLEMKLCPRTIAPQTDPVKMWIRDEVLKKGDAKTFIPSFTKDRLRTHWMQMYAKTKFEKSCSKSEALYSVYINEMDNRANGANPEQAEQVRRLKQKWFAWTHRKDPQPDPAHRTRYEAELDRLTKNLCDAWNGTQALKKTRIRNADERNEFLTALKNYVEVNDYDPFEYCPLTMVDDQGNTKSLKCLKTPTEIVGPPMLDRIQCQSRANIDDVHKRNERNHNRQQFDPQWLLLSDQEKRLKRLQDYENDVWDMAKQNYDYMTKVKAL